MEQHTLERNFINSPDYEGVFRPLFEKYLQSATYQLITAIEPMAVYRLQGTAACLTEILNLPDKVQKWDEQSEKRVEASGNERDKRTIGPEYRNFGRD